MTRAAGADYIAFRDRSSEQTVTLLDGRTITVVTMWLDHSNGAYWEQDPDSVAHFYYVERASEVRSSC